MSFNSEEFGLYAINVGSYWRCLKRKVTKSFILQNRTQSNVWRMSCTEIREETNHKEDTGAVQERDKKNLRFLKVVAFDFLTSNFLYLCLHLHLCLYLCLCLYPELWCFSHILSVSLYVFRMYIYILELILNIHNNYVF